VSVVDADVRGVPTVAWPHKAPAPDGWRFGRHVSLGYGESGDTGYWLIRESDDAALIARWRVDLDAEDAPSAEELDAYLAREAR